MVMQFEVSDHCLLSILLERGNGETEDDRAGLLEMLAAADELTSGWLVPLGVGLQFVHCDPANYFEESGGRADAHHFVRVATVPQDVEVEPPFSKSKCEIVPRIDASTIRNEVVQGLDEPAPPGLANSLSMLWWTAVRARSPIDNAFELLAPEPVAPIAEVIDSARWCFGPKSGSIIGRPAWLRCLNSHFTTEMILEVHWNLWVDYPPGRAMIDAGIARVLDRPGWEARQVYPPT